MKVERPELRPRPGRDAAGHCNVSITSGYLHMAVEDELGVGDLFSLAVRPAIAIAALL
jgi:hypothetical protein